MNSWMGNWLKQTYRKWWHRFSSFEEKGPLLLLSRTPIMYGLKSNRTNLLAWMLQSDDRLLFAGLLKKPLSLSRQLAQIVDFLSELCEKGYELLQEIYITYQFLLSRMQRSKMLASVAKQLSCSRTITAGLPSWGLRNKSINRVPNIKTTSNITQLA